MASDIEPCSCVIFQHIFNVAFRKRFLMHFFLRELILYRISLAFSDLNHDIAVKN